MVPPLPSKLHVNWNWEFILKKKEKKETLQIYYIFINVSLSSTFINNILPNVIFCKLENYEILFILSLKMATKCDYINIRLCVNHNTTTVLNALHNKLARISVPTIPVNRRKTNHTAPMLSKIVWRREYILHSIEPTSFSCST